MTWEARSREGLSSKVAAARRIFYIFLFWALKNQFLGKEFYEKVVNSEYFNTLQSMNITLYNKKKSKEDCDHFFLLI